MERRGAPAVGSLSDERVEEMLEPPFGERAGNRQQIVAMFERQVGAIAVGGVTA